MRDIDLDSLYERQLRAIGSTHTRNYPYLLLVYTGKITIGINLGNSFGRMHGSGVRGLRGGQMHDGTSAAENS